MLLAIEDFFAVLVHVFAETRIVSVEIVRKLGREAIGAYLFKHDLLPPKDPNQMEMPFCVRVLFRQPAGISLNVDHGHGAAELKLRNEIDRNAVAGRPSSVKRYCWGGLVVIEMPMRRDAAEIEAALGVASVKRIFQRLAERRVPFALKGEQAAEDRNERLRRVGAAGVGNGKDWCGEDAARSRPYPAHIERGRH